jgi:hypothetical protein
MLQYGRWLGWGRAVSHSRIDIPCSGQQHGRLKASKEEGGDKA